MCASQQGTGEQQQPPEPPQPHAPSPRSSRTPLRSYILLTFRPPSRRRQTDESLPGADQLPGSEPRQDSEPLPRSEPLSPSKPPPASKPLPNGEPLADSEPLSPSKPPPASKPLPNGEPLADSEPLSPSKPPPASKPLSASELRAASDPPHRDDPPQQVAHAQTLADTRAGVYTIRLLDASMIVIGAALFLCALATLSSTWAWSWHTGSGGILTLWRMHGICTSAMGELAQGASGTVASHCLWVDGTWTEAVALTGGGCILAVIGIARILRTRRTQA